MRTSFASRILEELLKPKLRYKGMQVNMLGLPFIFNKYKKKDFSNEVSRLKREGLICKEGKFFLVTKKGKEYVKRRQDSLSVFNFKYLKEAPKNLIVMFDIPEAKKAEREWFRFHLKKFDYIMVQRSVWVGPSPLPKDFMDYIKEIELKSCIKTFKLAKPYKEEKSR